MKLFKRSHRVRTPTVIQMEAVECGAASLAIILSYYGRHVSLEELRVVCNVTRDGVKAGNILRAARDYGLTSKGYSKDLNFLKTTPLPAVIFWNFNHFLVLEGLSPNKVYLNDPAGGPRTVTLEEFNNSYTGVVLTFKPNESFKSGRTKPNLLELLASRLKGAYSALGFVFLVSLILIIPGYLLPSFSGIFVDEILVNKRSFLPTLIALMLVIGGAMVVLLKLQYGYLLRLETKFSLKTSAEYFWHVLRMPVDFFLQRFAGDIANRVALNDEVAILLSRDLAATLLNILLISLYGILMLQFSVSLTLITVAIALINLATLGYISRRRKDANQRWLQDQGKLIGTAMGGLFNIESLKSRGSESILFSRIAGYHAKTIHSEQEFKLLSQILAAVPPTLSMLATVIVLILGSTQIIHGNMTVGMLIAFYALMTAFLLPVNNLVDLGGKLQKIEGGLNRLEDVLNYEEDRSVQNDELPINHDQIRLRGELELRHVTFGYNKLDKPLIQDFSIRLKPGDRVALVGASGSGKSTVAKLITGLYEPWEGDILFDGKHRHEIPRLVLANSLAMVDQDIFMIEGTVRENLTLWDYTLDQSAVVSAARDACIDEVISKRPGGYDSFVGEDGRNFSGGQKQRLEIARSLVMNPTILVLDEATSALDPITEQIIDENLRRRGCTTVIVAHRLSTIRDADEIIVLEAGKIVQRGTHDELYRKPGAYRTLIAAEDHKSDKESMHAIFVKLEEVSSDD